jgi:hypothetical protein
MVKKEENIMNEVKIFKEKGYCIIKNIISNELRDVITQYALFDEMQDFKSEGSQMVNSLVPDAHSKYADPAMESMLLHLLPFMEKHTGLALKPTYSFYRVYRKNDILEPHKDRPSCEISATLCFNYSYDDSKYTWPIYMDGYKAELYPGDMVIYRGCDLEHWREAFTPESINDWHVQGFFHYVDVNGANVSYENDRRPSIGLPLSAIDSIQMGSITYKTEIISKPYIEIVDKT